MAKKTIRIGVGDPKYPKSTLWSITIGGSDVYISQRFLHSLAKISLHNSGKWRFAVNSKNWTKKEDRALFKYERPNPVLESVVLGPTIVFPPLLAKEPLKLHDQYNKPIHWLSPPGINQERVVMIVFSKGERAIDDYFIKARLRPDWSISAPIKDNSRLNADTVRIVSWVEPLRDFSKNQIYEVIARTRINYKKGSSPVGIFGVATPIYPGTDEERARGLSPTIIEIILGKHNLEEERKYKEGMKVRIKSLNLEGYIVKIIGHKWVICNQDIAIDPSIGNTYAATEEIIKRLQGDGLECNTISGVTEDSEEIEILPRT